MGNWGYNPTYGSYNLIYNDRRGLPCPKTRVFYFTWSIGRLLEKLSILETIYGRGSFRVTPIETTGRVSMYYSDSILYYYLKRCTDFKYVMYIIYIYKSCLHAYVSCMYICIKHGLERLWIPGFDPNLEFREVAIQ